MKNERALGVLILAAGQGTRMKSDKAKVLHEIGGAPLIRHVLDCAAPLHAERTVVVVGHQAEEVKIAVAASGPSEGIRFALQTVRLGTGHAVLSAESAFDGFSGDVLILSGDVPLLRTGTLSGALASHFSSKSDLTVLTFRTPRPTGYGRILRDGAGALLGNVEERDATPEQKAVDEVNSGIYIVDSELLFRLLKNVKAENDQKEYYLTDIIALAVAEGRVCRASLFDDPAEAQGVNTIDDLERAGAVLKERQSGTRGGNA